MRIRLIAFSFLCLCVIASNLHGAKKEKKAVTEAPSEPPVYYAVEVFDLFDERTVSVCTTKEMQDISRAISEKNKAAPLAYKRVTKEWTESEKLRIEALEAKNKKRKSGEKLPKQFARPFVIDKPQLVSMKADGPYDNKEDASAKAAERADCILKDSESAEGASAQRRTLMSERVLKDYEAAESLAEEQEALFLAALDSLKGKNSLLASGGRIKQMGGKITPIAKNMHRMMKPAASEKTATKVDPRAVMQQ